MGRGEGTAGEKAYVVHSQGGLVGSTLFLADVRNQVLFTCCLACSCCWQQEEWVLVRLGRAVSARVEKFRGGGSANCRPCRVNG